MLFNFHVKECQRLKAFAIVLPRDSTILVWPVWYEVRRESLNQACITVRRVSYLAPLHVLCTYALSAQLIIPWILYFCQLAIAVTTALRSYMAKLSLEECLSFFVHSFSTRSAGGWHLMYSKIHRTTILHFEWNIYSLHIESSWDVLQQLWHALLFQRKRLLTSLRAPSWMVTSYKAQARKRFTTPAIP